MTAESRDSKHAAILRSLKPAHYHCHIYFSETTADKARGLYQLASSNPSIEAVGRFHLHPIGPHPCCQFQLLVKTTQLGEVTEWIERHRDGLDVLIHPEIEDDYEAHTTYAYWLGNAQPLCLDLFKPEATSN
ncbi:MAG: DOPA 4,5-dioxygenase family protein [Bradymonadia bacterium]